MADRQVLDHLLRESYSWGEFVDRAEISHSTGDGRSYINAASQRWDLGAGFDGAVQLARDGWPEGEIHARNLSSALFDKISSLIEREYPVYDVEGSGIDVARYLSGEPECWQRMESRATEGPGRRLIRIVFNYGLPHIIDARVQLAKGAALVALIELLEFAGHSVEVTVVSLVRSMNRSFETTIRVKDTDQPIDLPRLCFAIAHPAMFRRLYFSIAEQVPAEFVRDIGTSAYGVPSDEIDDCGDIYVGASTGRVGDWTSEDFARAWIVSRLTEQGVVLRDA